MHSHKGKEMSSIGDTTIIGSLSRVSLLLVIIFASFLVIRRFQVNAESITTSVTVGNSAPTFTVGPAENPASSTTSPTNVGSNVTFQATATDANNNNYYLIVCSSNSVTPGSGAAPTCGATTYCTSTSTVSGAQASCSRTALAGDPASNTWYAFVCDGIASGSACSTANQGSGDSGSPFIVNHAPTFSNPANNSPVNPGGTVTWTSTASDPDSNTVMLLVCKTSGITGNTCTGGAWCTSSLVSSNPSCNYSVPSVNPDGSNNAYVYIIDQFNFPSTSGSQGGNVPFTINNVAPTVSAVTINGGSAIDLVESSTKSVTLTATVSDNNSCSGEISTVYGYVYRSGITYTGCDTAGEANNNYCYPEISCSVVGGTCSGTTDASADYTCTVNLQYYADPTDVNTLYPTETWLDTIKAIDNNSASGNTTVGAGVEVNSLTAFDITSSLAFGNLGAGQSNDPLDKTVTTTATGNVGLDQEHSGSANMCVDYPTCAGGTPIGVVYQKYALASSTAYTSATALSTTPTEVELNVPKPINATPVTKNTWWGILIPTGTQPGTYSGVNTITAVKGETANW